MWRIASCIFAWSWFVVISLCISGRGGSFIPSSMYDSSGYMATSTTDNAHKPPTPKTGSRPLSSILWLTTENIGSKGKLRTWGSQSTRPQVYELIGDGGSDGRDTCSPIGCGVISMSLPVPSSLQAVVSWCTSIVAVPMTRRKQMLPSRRPARRLAVSLAKRSSSINYVVEITLL